MYKSKFRILYMGTGKREWKKRKKKLSLATLIFYYKHLSSSAGEPPLAAESGGGGEFSWLEPEPPCTTNICTEVDDAENG